MLHFTSSCMLQKACDSLKSVTGATCATALAWQNALSHTSRERKHSRACLHHIKHWDCWDLNPDALSRHHTEDSRFCRVRSSKH